MTEDRPPLLTGGSRRRLRRSRRRSRSRRHSRSRATNLSRVLLLVPLAGAIALAAIVLGSSNGDDGAARHATSVRPESLAQPVKPPRHLAAAAGGGEESRFAVNLTGTDPV